MLDAKAIAAIANLKAEMMTSFLRAMIHVSRANTGLSKKRIVVHGDDTPFTDEEKIEDDLETAERHIQRIQELRDSVVDLLK